MKPIFVLVAFYVFVLLLLAGTSYLVFILKVTPEWWFFPVASLIVFCKPKIVNHINLKSPE